MDSFDTFADLLSGLYGPTTNSSQAFMTAEIAEACLRSTIASLKAAKGHHAHIASMLDGARLALSNVDSDTLSVDASIAVVAIHLSALRAEVEHLKPELAAAIAHEGWRLRDLQLVAAAPEAKRIVSPPKRGEMVEQLAYAIADKKAYEVKAFCDYLGLPDHPDPEAKPWNSKAVYARGRLAGLDMAELARTSRSVLDEIDSPPLQALLDRHRPAGPAGIVKNLIFGSTRKPDLVLADALSNDIAPVNTDAALIYDDGIPEEGLSWRKLVRALMRSEAATDERAAARRLYARLLACLGSEPERLFFQAYGTRYRSGFDQPALVPQVWVHYDPRSRRQRGDAPVLTTQRMDFLLLLANGRRVVCEIDGRTHYTDESGQPSPLRYSQMVRDDRELRLRGYEIYRFGAAELPSSATASTLVEEFFGRLID